MKIYPRQNDIVGYESPVCLELLISLMTARIEGDAIPAVKLFTFDQGKSFEIPYVSRRETPCFEGGHHRTLCAYLLGESLEAEIVPSVPMTGLRGHIPDALMLYMPEIRITSDPERFKFQKDILGNVYRELPCPETFFSRYRAINTSLRCALDFDYSLTRVEYSQMLDRLSKERGFEAFCI